MGFINLNFLITFDFKVGNFIPNLDASDQINFKVIITEMSENIFPSQQSKRKKLIHG